MAQRHLILTAEEEDVRISIPADVFTYEGFQRWVDSRRFPESGRIDYLEGDVDVDLSPEELFTHNVVKVAIASKLYRLVGEGEIGNVFMTRTRVWSPVAEISVEPDVVAMFWSSLKAGRIRLVPAPFNKEPNRFSGIEGAVDLVVEIVSDSSVKKDTKRLPKLYARAGIPELWNVDARGRHLRFQIHTLQDGAYVAVEPDSEGWVRSPRLGVDFRLVRRRAPLISWRYTLEHRQP
jgi:Uma2 family endonuclease